MRLVRIRTESDFSYGILRGADDVIDLISGDPFDESGRQLTGKSVPLAQARLLAPTEPSKILAVGRNFAAHAEEMGLALGKAPSVFIKPLQTIVAHGESVVLPSDSDEVQHEGELAVVIGRTARHVRKAEAGDVVLGFTCADDVSARDFQRSDPQITRGKGFDTFCPLGPWVETDVSVDDDLEVTCSVNGELRQRGRTRDLIYDIPTMIEWLSSWTTLLPGDVILTGSPAGTGPLLPGDKVEVAVERIGTLMHSVVAAGD